MSSWRNTAAEFVGMPVAFRRGRGTARPGRATAIWLGTLVGGRGLLGQGQVEHLLGKHFADFEGDVFDLGKLDPPGRALGAGQLLAEVCRDALDVGAQFFHLGGRFLVRAIPWLLSELGSNE